MKNKFSLLVIAIAVSMAVVSCKKDNEESSPSNGGGNGGGVVPLISNEKTGTPFNTGTVNKFSIASNGSSVVLLLANNTTGKIYAVDLKDNKAADATANAVNGPIADFASQIASKMGIALNTIRIRNIEVNPISKSIYVLAGSSQSNNNMLFKATNKGTTVEAVSLDNVSYSEITFSTASHRVNDMTWGDNSLFVSFSHSATLKGEVATIKAPFADGSALSSRATTVYKTNWGGGYHTDAPLETMTFAEVAGKKRLMGITVCAPGFSFETSDISNGAGVLEVNEYYNLNTRSALKVFPVYQNGKTYLIEIHDNGRVTRVGQKYIDGSQTQINDKAKYLLTGGGSTVANGLTDEDVKIIAVAGSYVMVSKYSDTQLLVMNTTGAVSILDI